MFFCRHVDVFFSGEICVILRCAERATQVALQAIQTLGGNGYINDYATGRLLRDAKLYEIGAGSLSSVICKKLIRVIIRYQRNSANVDW
jgi:hypothetical protein